MERLKSQPYLWNPPGVSVNAALAPEVLAALRRAAAGDSKRPGEEVGGILLGTYASDDEEGYLVSVDGFEPFEIEHRYGPTYGLSLRDMKRLRQRIERLEHSRSGLRPVGLFRTHFRRGLYMDQRDFDLFHGEFRHPAAIYLLARPEEDGGATGAIFIWEGEDVRRHASYLEFALGSRVLDDFVQVPEATRGTRVAAPVPLIAESAAAETVRRPVNELPGLGWRLPSLSLPKFGLPALRLRFAPGVPKLNWAQARIPVLLFAAIGLPLAAFYLGRDVGLRESKDQAPGKPTEALTSARRTARRHAQPRAETGTEVARAALVALPAHDPAPPRVETPAPQASPVVTQITPDEGADEAPAAAPPLMRSKPDTAVRTAAPAPANYRERADRGRKTASAIRIWKTPELRAEHVAPTLPEPPQLTARAVVPSAALPASLYRVHTPPTKVVAYVKPSRSGFGKVLRTIGGMTDKFVPANPVEHPLPPTPAIEPGDGETVELAAKVDRSGKVVKVKVVEGDRRFAQLSADALQRWKFEPAKQNGAPVDSEMLVRFEFSGVQR